MLLRVISQHCPSWKHIAKWPSSYNFVFGSNKEMNKENVYGKIMLEYFVFSFHSLFVFAVLQVIF